MSKFKTGALLAPAIFGIVITLLPMLDSQQWWVRIWDFPRLQVFCWCAFCAILVLAFLRPRNLYSAGLATILLGCSVYQGLQILPYTPIYPVQVQLSGEKDSAERFTLLTANVLTTNRDVASLLNLVKRVNPDILLLTEPDSHWLKALDELKETYPHTLLHPLDNTYGIALYSRLPLKNGKIEFLVESDVPSIQTKLVLPSGREVQLHGIHPRPPAPTESEDTIERDAELIVVGKKVRKQDLPAIVAGDLNDVAWSPTTRLFQDLSGMLDPRRGRGFYNTFHAQIPVLRFPLDHVFHTAHFRLVEMRCLPDIGSDHYPFLIELSLEESAEQSQQVPPPSVEDKIDSEEILEKAKQEKAEDRAAK